MNYSEIERLKEILNRILEIDFLNTARDIYPNENLDEMKIAQEYPLIEGITLLNRAVKQLNSEINSENGKYLPYKLGVPDMGNSDIWDPCYCLNRILELKDHPTNFPQIGHYIRWLISYEVLCGFWDKSSQKVHNVDEIKIESQLKEIEYLSSQVKTLIKKNKDLQTQNENAINSINELTRQKNEELNQISNLVGKASNESGQITQLWEQATRQKGDFDNLINQASESIKNINTQIESQKNEYSKLKNEIQQESSSLNFVLEESNNKLKDINSKDSIIKKRMDEAAALLGLSADSALGNKFSTRETKVKRELKWWRIAVLISVVLAILWAVIVFIYFQTKTALPYLDILVNLVKTTPGFILMGYIMAQYNKERAIEEEYAFKAAIAMTINAYANLLSDNDYDNNKSRQTMLLNAIEQVYKKPKLHKENVSAKTYKENAKELIDILKNYKS